MKKKTILNLKNNIIKVIKLYDSILLQNCNGFRSFTGRDIDCIYHKKKFSHQKIVRDTILRKVNNNSFRLYLNNFKNTDFLSLDFEEISCLPLRIKLIFEKKFFEKKFCKKTKLYHISEKGLIFLKLYKYFLVTINSYNQLKLLKENIKKLSTKDLKFLLHNVKIAMPNEIKIIEKFIFWDFNKFVNNRNIKKFFLNLKNKREQKRIIFNGNLISKKIIFSKKFLFSFFLNSIFKWEKSHNPLPAIAIIGNDGSGKTTVTEYIRKNFYKMDPLIIDMKASNPFLTSTRIVRNFLLNTKKNSLLKNTLISKYLISFLGEILDYFDKYLKYKIGIAWADSGHGITIFERYPTDRVRGEFPNSKSRFFPIEQFFPFPDGIVYLDVLPKDTLLRKKKDNHTFGEMVSKRKNYLTLLKEFDEYKFIKAETKINKKICIIKNYIFYLYNKKKQKINVSGKPKRVVWKKNINRVLSGNKLNRSQKGGFFE